ncbi:4-hydroxy-tetrahydrodipicolinate synthase [Burkholderia sp. MR1-5-21]
MEQSWKVKFAGVFTDLVTPFKERRLDTHALEAHVERLLDFGVHGVVPAGASGEAATLTESETAEAIRVAVRSAKGRAFVLASIDSNDTMQAIYRAKLAADLGVDGLLVATPYYNRPAQDGLFEHFAAVASAARLPVMVNCVCRHAGTELAPETAARLVAQYPNIVGIKEISGKLNRVTELRLKCGNDFVVHCGDDSLALAFYAVGADGVVSVASNLIPRELLELYAAWRQGDMERALMLHERMFELIQALGAESSPVSLKVALALSGFMEDEVRLPLARLSSESQSTLLQCLELYSVS